jgi:hypothetical protein
MPKEAYKTELRIQVPLAATPQRVEAAARLFVATLDAAGIDLGDESVTMIVRNREMRAYLRGWDEEGASAINAIATTIRDPLRAAQSIDRAPAIAAAVARYSREVGVGAVFRRGQGGRPLATIDERFIEVMKAAAKPTEAKEPRIRGRTEVASAVLRVGRLTPNASTQARIILAGKPRDVLVADGAEAALHDAAKDRDRHRVILSAEWTADQDGAYSVDLDRVVVLGVKPLGKPISGEEFLKQATDLSDETVEAIEDGLHGGEFDG